jgi:hypothetical protein
VLNKERMIKTETNLMIKEVDFNGANLLAAQDNDGKIFVGVSYICNGIGLSDGQMKI